MHYSIWLNARTDGCHLVCHAGDGKRSVDCSVFRLFLSAAISDFLHRRCMGRQIQPQKHDYPRRWDDCGSDACDGFHDAHDFIGNGLLTALLVMSAIRSLGAGIQMPTVSAVIPSLVPEKHLMRYNGINATMQSVVQFVAPAAAGAILSVGTLRATLLIDILTAVFGIGLLSCVRIARQIPQEESGSMLSEMKTGIRYSFSDKRIGKLLIVYGLFIFLSVPAGFMAGLLVSRVYGDTYWYLTASELVGFAGMTIGGMLMGIWGGFRNRIKTLTLGLVVLGIMTIGMGVSPYFILYLVLMFVYSIAITVIQTATTTLIQETADTAMQGRVFGLMGAMYSGFLPLGMLAFGPLADLLPLQWLMIGTGIPLLFISFYFIIMSTE